MKTENSSSGSPIPRLATYAAKDERNSSGHGYGVQHSKGSREIGLAQGVRQELPCNRGMPRPKLVETDLYKIVLAYVSCFFLAEW